MNSDVVIIGAGGHGKVIADMILASGDNLIGFLDDGLPPGSNVMGIPVLGGIPQCREFSDRKFVIALGSGGLRKRISEEYGFLNWYSPCHKRSWKSPFAKIGSGTAVHAFAVVNPDAEVGDHCIINTGAIVEHDCKIGNFCHLAPNSALGGNVILGENVFIGLGSSIRNGISITSDVIIGCGSTVVKDIDLPGTYVGNPLRKIK